MANEIMRELIIIAGVNIAIFLAASGYIDHKFYSKNSKKKKGFIE